MKPTTPEVLDRAFDRLVECAVRGERCPTNDQFQPRDVVPQIAKLGRIRIEVYAHNYRVVTILSGPHAGKTTAPCPMKGSRPHIRIDQHGRHLRPGHRYANRPPSSVPSKPRLLTSDDLK